MQRTLQRRVINACAIFNCFRFIPCQSVRFLKGRVQTSVINNFNDIRRACLACHFMSKEEKLLGLFNNNYLRSKAFAPE